MSDVKITVKRSWEEQPTYGDTRIRTAGTDREALAAQVSEAVRQAIIDAPAETDAVVIDVSVLVRPDDNGPDVINDDGQVIGHVQWRN